MASSGASLFGDDTNVDVESYTSQARKSLRAEAAEWGSKMYVPTAKDLRKRMQNATWTDIETPVETPQSVGTSVSQRRASRAAAVSKQEAEFWASRTEHRTPQELRADMSSSHFVFGNEDAQSMVSTSHASQAAVEKRELAEYNATVEDVDVDDLRKRIQSSHWSYDNVGDGEVVEWQAGQPGSVASHTGKPRPRGVQPEDLARMEETMKPVDPAEMHAKVANAHWSMKWGDGEEPKSRVEAERRRRESRDQQTHMASSAPRAPSEIKQQVEGSHWKMQWADADGPSGAQEVAGKPLTQARETRFLHRKQAEVTSKPGSVAPPASDTLTPSHRSHYVAQRPSQENSLVPPHVQRLEQNFRPEDVGVNDSVSQVGRPDDEEEEEQRVAGEAEAKAEPTEEKPAAEEEVTETEQQDQDEAQEEEEAADVTEAAPAKEADVQETTQQSGAPKEAEGEVTPPLSPMPTLQVSTGVDALTPTMSPAMARSRIAGSAQSAPFATYTNDAPAVARPQRGPAVQPPPLPPAAAQRNIARERALRYSQAQWSF